MSPEAGDALQYRPIASTKVLDQLGPVRLLFAARGQPPDFGDAEAVLQINDDIHRLLKQNTTLTQKIDDFLCRAEHGAKGEQRAAS